MIASALSIFQFLHCSTVIMALPLTVSNVFLLLKEFLTVWCYQILYYNEVYPAEVFMKAKSFDSVVYCSRNPLLTEYFDGLITRFLKILIEGNGRDNGGRVNSLLMVLYDTRDNTAKEHYILQFSEMVHLGPAMNSEFLNKTPSDLYDKRSLPILDIPNFTWTDLYGQLRMVLFNLLTELRKKRSHMDAQEKEFLFYKVLVDLDDTVDLNIAEEENGGSPWVRLNSTTMEESSSANVKIASLGEVSAGFVSVGAHNKYLK